MNTYKIGFTFSTNKELSESEFTNLMNALLLQIEEPTDYEQNPEEYETSQITYEIEEVK
jgi:hypothetical protein